MTESDKLWLDERFNSIKQGFESHKENCEKRFQGIEKWVGNVEKKTEVNSQFIWIAIGGGGIVAALIGILEFSIR